MTDYGNIIDSIAGDSRATAASGVVGSIQDSPDDAQRAFELAESSGIPADQIYGNLDAFERYYKGAMASQIVQNNPHLQDFANSHPLAPKLANDDWGNLDTVSRSVQQIGQKSVLTTGIEHYLDSSLASMQERQARREQFNRALLTGFAQGFGPGGPGSWLDEPISAEEAEKEGVVGGIKRGLEIPLWSAAATLGAPAELGFRAFSGLFEAGTAGFKEALRQQGFSNEQAESLGGETNMMAQLALMHAGVSGPHLPPELNTLARQAAVDLPKVKPYLDAGVEPPRGVSTITDQAKANQAKIDIDNLIDALGEAQKSNLRERNPDMFADFIRQHTQAEIGISSEAVRKLYGETIPSPDDGLLGFIPGIDDQLIGAEPTGGDIHIPLADWLAKVDPKVARELRDDTRVRRGGVTLAEAKDLEPLTVLAEQPEPQEGAKVGEQAQAPVQVTEPTEEDLSLNRIDDVRHQGGYVVNRFSLQKVSQGEGRFANVHDYDFVDSEGNRIGDIQLTYDEAKKDLHVEYVRHDQGPQAFGLKAMRDITRQLQSEFPDAQTISGERVSGAREVAARDETGSVPRDWAGEHVSVPLSRAGELLSDLTDRGGQVTQTGSYVTNDGLEYIPTGKLSTHEAEIVNAVSGVFSKIAPRLVEARSVRGIRSSIGPSYAIFANFRTRMPLIIWSLESPDAVGTARHEIIHHLRRTGFLTKDEWDTLRDTAVKENWIQKYNIMSRYKGQSLAHMIEESVAEHFAHWYREEYASTNKKFTGPTTGLAIILQKIGRLYESLRTAVRGVVGKDTDWRDLFTRIESGEVGRRRDVKPLDPREFRGSTYQLSEAQAFQQKGNQMLSRAAQKKNEPELPGITRVEDRPPFAEGALRGMTVRTQRKYMDLMALRDQQDMEFARKQNEKDVARRQTEEWKANEKRIRDQIKPEFEQRPDLAADKFLREGMLYGEKVRGKPRLDGSKLTPEQKAALPPDYVGAHGLHPDDAAGLFGFHSGDEMVDALAAVHADRTRTGLTPGRYVNHLIDGEVARRMQTEHGDLAQNILSEAQDHVISQTQFDMLHEETLHAAMQAGIDTTKSSPELPFTKEHMEQFARQRFAQLKMGQVSVEAHLRDGLRANELAERALLDGDFTEAFKQKQRQAFAFLYAREAKRLEKVQNRFDKLMKKYSARTVNGVEADYINYIHQLMQRFGIGVRRGPQDIATEIAAKGMGTLQEFVDHKNSEYGAMQLDDRLYDPNFKKKIDQMSVEEFRAVSDAFTMLNKTGMDERKVIRAGEKEDLADLSNRGITQLETFPLKEYSLKPGKFKGLTDLAKHYMTVGIINAETWLNRWDRDNLNGVFNQWLVRPLTASAYRERTLGREFSKDYKDLGEIKDVTKLIRSPFIDPLTKTRDDDQGQVYSGFTRENVAAMISNAGNPYNFDILTRGHGADAETTWNWLVQNSIKEDWVRAEKMGKIFNKAFDMAQTVYRNIYGVAPPKIELQPFKIRFQNGDVFSTDGWYHPIIRDPIRTNMVRAARGEELLDKDRGLFPSIANGYTKQRTGKVDVLALDHNSVVSRLNQILHDVAFRSEVIEANKLVKDGKLRQAIRQYYGDQYVPMLDNWLADIAGASNVPSGLMAEITRASNYARTNVIGSLIGFNPGTVAKHGPTALVNSMYEVGLKNFAKSFAGVSPTFLRESVMQLFTGSEDFSDRQLQFIWDNSEAIRNRAQNWEETIGGQHQIVTGKPTLRNKIIRWGSVPVAMSDMLSALPTWLAAYKEEFANEGNHGNSVFASDRAVRRAHGDISVTNLPELVRRSGPFGSWLTTLYGFFSTQMQRRAEIAFQTNDIYKLGREGELKKAASNILPLTGLIFATAIWPTVVEEYVNSIGTDDRRGPLTRTFMAGLGGLASSFLYFRDLIHGATTGQEPSVGMASTPAHDISSVFKEAAHPVKSMDRTHAAKTVSDWLTVFGETTGLFPKQAARVVRFGLGTKLGTEHPKGPADVAVGLMRGTTKRRIER